MFLSNASLKRPVAMSCLIIGLTLLGINAYRKMGLEMMPRTDLPFVTIVTVYPGATPEQIETDIAKRIEDQVVTIDGLKHVNSSCMENVCQTLLEFQLDVDVDIVATDVREKLDLIRADFPQDVEDPQILKFDINAQPIIYLALTGDATVEELYDYADNTLRDRITVLSGVADVELIGGAEREVHVVLDRDKLAARGLSSLDVVGAVQQGMRTIPSGRIRGHGTEYSVKFDAEYGEVPEIGSLEVAAEGGQRCYINDLGKVMMTTEELRQKATVDGQSCVAVRIVKKAEANAVRVVQSVRAAMDRLNKDLPGGMELIWVHDSGRFIEASVRSAWSDVGQGIALTALVLFFFLYNIRATLVVTITMPLTILIGLFFIQAMGFTLNTSTLLATGMSVGILVTNSIVVLEAIAAHLARTGDPREASRLGAAESGIAVLASAGTNIVVLFPIAVMSSLVGLFMKPFAWTMLIMTAVSLFISFTLTPILCSVLLKPQKGDSRSPVAYMERGWNRMFGVLSNGYRAVLTFNERHRLVATLVLVVVAIMLVQSFGVAKKLGFGLANQFDQGQINVKLEYPTRYNLQQTERRVQQAEALLRDLPELKHVLTTIGKVEGVIGQSSEGVYLAQIFLRFSERTERTIPLDEIQEQVRRRLGGTPECIVTVSVPSFVGGTSSNIEMVISGERLEVLDDLALQGRQAALALPGFLDADTTVRVGKPELRIRPDRAVLADLGMPATNLGLALRANIEGIEAGTFKRAARNYDVVVKLADEEGKDQVNQFLFPGAPGHPLLLASLGQVEETLAPVQITRRDKQRISKILANIATDKPLGTAVEEISRGLEKVGLPPGYTYAFAGQYEVMAEGQAAFGEAGMIAVILVVLTLAAILESFKQPWLIMMTIPLTLPGVFWALALTGANIGIFVLMGVVMMMGIVVNNAILIMDQLNVHIRQGVPRHQAMVRAAVDELRPVVMITLAAVLGMWPLAAGKGIGAEMRNDIGAASMGGILISGILTLLVVPILYDLFTRRSKKKA